MTRNYLLIIPTIFLMICSCGSTGGQSGKKGEGAEQVPQKPKARTMYVRAACAVLEHPDSAKIAAMIFKGDSVRVVPAEHRKVGDSLAVTIYKTKLSDDKLVYIHSQYLVETKAEADSCYMSDYYDPIRSQSKDRFNGGDPLGAEIFPREKIVASERKMPQACYCLYLPANGIIIKNIDEYIALAKRTKINTFILDIKEDGTPAFKADAMKKYVPTAYNRAPQSKETYKALVEKLHENGLWVVARIVTFKDYHLTKDHPECALWDKAQGKMLFHNKSNWPSAYSRYVWEYNVALACEAVRDLGFDEINFDYVRFPDRMMKIEHNIEMRNKYGESKLQAIQRFVSYAVDQIHRAGAYVSIDVFGEAANPGYTTAYGQYWPAISNVADVMSGMPYPDHFTNGYYGISKPWNHPYELMYQWGIRVQDRQRETVTPAVVRTWVQAYHVMKHVDPDGIDYMAENMKKEIRGLYDAGLVGGYAPWLSSGSLERYKGQAEAYNIDYLKEWKDKQSAKKIEKAAEAPAEE